MTKFKVNDQVRLVENPSIKGPVQSVRFNTVTIEHEGEFLAYRADRLEHVPATDDAWATPAELAELRGWAKGVEDMSNARPGKMDGTSDLDLPQPDDDPHQDLVNDMRDLLQDWKDTFDKKQRAYGPKAIANAPLGAAEGLLNRIHDKYSRLVQLMQNPDVDDLGEATADTVKDMGIYCAMLVLVNEGKWPGV